MALPRKAAALAVIVTLMVIVALREITGIGGQGTGTGYRKFAGNAGATVNETGRLAVRLYFSEAGHAEIVVL